MAERDELEEWDEEEPQTFTWPLLGALHGSVVIVAGSVNLISNLVR